MDPKRQENTQNMDTSEKEHNYSKTYESFNEFVHDTFNLK